MIAFIIFVSCFCIGWFGYAFIEWRRDRRFRQSIRNKFDDSWRQVPPPNWASRRGTQDYW